MNKKLLSIIILAVILLLVGGFIIYKNIDIQKNPTAKNTTLTKPELKNIIDTFTISFSSTPYDTQVEYNFVNKTKTIIHYTSGSNEHTDEVVEYDRFDELFDYLYNTVFSNSDELTGSLNNTSNDDIAKPYYDMYVYFNSKNKVYSYSNNWIPSINSNTQLANWTLNGYTLPSYWNEFLKILEIDESILSDGTSYNFSESIY